MASITKREKLARASLYDIGYEYLRVNFRKFNERNKIKVAIAILQIFEKDDSKTKNPQSIINIIRADQSTHEIKPLAGCETNRLSG